MPQTQCVEEVVDVPMLETVTRQEACADIGGLCEEDKTGMVRHLKGGMPAQRGKKEHVVYDPTMREGNAAGSCGKEAYMAYSTEEACAEASRTCFIGPT